MAYSIVFTKAAKRQFDKLPKPAQRQLPQAGATPGGVIESLAADPRPAGVVKLSGEERLYRVRSGDYRAIYQVEDNRLLMAAGLVDLGVSRRPADRVRKAVRRHR
jgi:mRNA interferase RelE/StbE